VCFPIRGTFSIPHGNIGHDFVSFRHFANTGHSSEKVNILGASDGLIKTTDRKEGFSLDKGSLQGYPLSCQRLYQAVSIQPVSKL
jgi:hypothetical protein